MELRSLSTLLVIPLLGLLAACESTIIEEKEEDGWSYPHFSISEEDKIPLKEAELCEEDCERLCPDLREEIACRVDLQGGDVDCEGAPVELAYLGVEGGMVLKIDMSAHKVLQIDADLTDPTGWIFNLGDSQTNNGNAGDGATTSHDSEAQLVGTHLALWRSDYGDNLKTISEPNAIAADTDTATITVCDSAFAFSSSVIDIGMYDPAIFQIDGDEEDVERQDLNDQFLWLGVEQVIAGGGDRVGDGVADLWLTFGS